MNALTDVHAHMCDPTFDRDRRAVLTRARHAGVEAIITVGEDLDDARRNLDMARRYTVLKPAAGLYPAHLDMDRAMEMAEFISQNRAELVAIGEVGLDYWLAKEDSEREIQREILKIFINLSNRLNLPLNIHSRSAGRQAIALLLEQDARQAHLHAFDGKAGSALPAVEAGYFFSIPPSVVRSPQKQKLVKRLPLACMLVETDSPVLGVMPGERNEPANVTVAVRAIAQLKGISEAEVIETVAQNTKRLYGDLL